MSTDITIHAGFLPHDVPDGNVLGLLQNRRAPTPAPELSVVATPSIGSPTTSISG
jgi:hypothetical protein